MQLIPVKRAALAAVTIGAVAAISLTSACKSDNQTTTDAGPAPDAMVTPLDGATAPEGGGAPLEGGALPDAGTAEGGGAPADAGPADGGSTDSGPMPADATSDDARSEAGGMLGVGQTAVATFARPESDLTGRVDFTAAGSSVMVTAHIEGAEPGLHGIHIHVTGVCDADAGHTGAGDHWNPLDAGHACPPTTPRHKGDFGNIPISDAGSGVLSITMPDTAISELVGRAIIIHAAPDDCTSQPTGNSGARSACAVIRAQ